ncbi:zinc-binding protein A33-like [Lithobates pipiens]
MASAVMEEDVKCSICLNLYTGPVTLTCGHNFCQECIETHLDTKETNGEEHSCPRCRKRFRRRPKLKKNTDLSNIAEKVKSSADQENRKCSDHNRILELYCTDDATCICVFCMVEGEHGGHKVERLEVSSEKKKKKLRDDLPLLKAEREKTEKRVQNLHNRRKMARKQREAIKGKVAALFKEIRKRVDILENRVRSDLSRQVEQEDPVSDLIRKLELKMDEMSKKIGRLEELNAADPITLLQDRDSDRHTEEDTGLCWNETAEPDEFLASIRSHIGLSMMIRKSLSDIMNTKDTHLPELQPTGIALDTNTAADNVQISKDRKSAASTDVKQTQPNTANRFESSQVLSTNTFSSGQHYWMVETSTSGDWAVGMGYPSMRRRGGWLGENKSWGIGRTGHSYQMLHNGESKLLSHAISSDSLLVYLDYEAGRLSFYELSDPPNILHTFTTTFTEPLHAALQLRKDFIYNSHSQIRVI